MEKKKLTQKFVESLKLRQKDYVIRDTIIPGYGVRVYPTGRKLFFVQTQNRGRRKQESLGTTAELGEAKARELALACTAEGKAVAGKKQLEIALFEDVGAMFFERYKRNWKSSTILASRNAYERDILPFFKGMQIAIIDKNLIKRWFASLGNRAGPANRALPVLSVMMQQAELYGYRPDNTNPCKGIPRYKMAPSERFLSAVELARLGQVLQEYKTISPVCVAFFHLLILTGCRKSEIINLKWTDYKHGKLYLPDSKTGAKTVYLSTAACAVLDAIPRTSSPYVLPARSTASTVNNCRGACNHIVHWSAIRKRAGLEGVRMHDLRHTYASIALEHGEHILTIGRLLGHVDPETTLKYAHLANGHVRETARDVASAIAGELK